MKSTSSKRITLIAVACLGLGALGVGAANAAPQPMGSTPTATAVAQKATEAPEGSTGMLTLTDIEGKRGWFKHDGKQYRAATVSFTTHTPDVLINIYSVSATGEVQGLQGHRIPAPGHHEIQVGKHVRGNYDRIQIHQSVGTDRDKTLIHEVPMPMDLMTPTFDKNSGTVTGQIMGVGLEKAQLQLTGTDVGGRSFDVKVPVSGGTKFDTNRDSGLVIKTATTLHAQLVDFGGTPFGASYQLV